MTKSLSYFLFVLVIALSWTSLSGAANAARKGNSKVPARVHFSGNIEGELEPCG
jgi:hypothetical protein